MRFQAELLVVVFTMLSLMGLSASAAAPVPEARDESRAQYGDVVRAIDRGNWTEYERFRPGLEDYPLAMYLDYSKLTSNLRQVRPTEANRFIGVSEDSPLPNRFLSAYLHRAGKDRRWKDFLAVKPDEPNNVDLKCYYFRAQLAQGDELAAWEGAERLWVHGRSRPKQCDPLFAAWLKAGQLSDEVVWARMIKAFDERQSSLLKYVAKKGSDQLAPWSARLISVYGKPESLGSQRLTPDSPYSADLAAHGVAHLARYNPEKAIALWLEFQQSLVLSDEQVRHAEYTIAWHSLLSKNETAVPWLSTALRRLGEDKLVEVRLRWILGEQNWQILEDTLPLLSQAGGEKNVWRYWRAIALLERGEKDESRKLLKQVAQERDYYGFLAADRLGEDYQFNHQKLVLREAASADIAELPALGRIEELYFHDEARLAHSEWYKVLSDETDTERRQELAQVASAQGWHHMAINAASKAKAWDVLDVRFPTPYQNTFDHYAAVQRVPSTELMAIARRESAFFPGAQSAVGARGLMQIMPATGKQVASQLGKSHNGKDLYQVEHNVLLGSAYYRQLLDRFEGNRVFALTAYNAGPHRVKRWRHSDDESVPVEIWIETIPYRETRNYVQAVLSYNVVFQYLLGDDSYTLLSETERNAPY